MEEKVVTFDITHFESTGSIHDIQDVYQAYFLGTIFNDNTNKYVILTVNEKDKNILTIINDKIFNNKLVLEEKMNKVIMSGILPEKYLNISNEFPNINRDCVNHFVRGYIESNTNTNTSYPKLDVMSKSLSFLEELKKIYNLPYTINTNNNKSKVYNITLHGNTLLDFLGDIYKTAEKDKLYLVDNLNYYKYICNLSNTKDSYFNYVKKNIDAVAPFKSRTSDSGYDLTLIKKIKTNGNTEFYDTGIIVQPSYGYYFDLVPRSSISKSGYILANNIGIIDRTYTGTIIVPLIKIDHSKPDLELPIRLVQIIPRQIQHLTPIEITEEELMDTDRGSGGFGSTNK